jgi:hypothetical protein
MELNATVAKKRLVKLDGAKVIHNTATATDDPIGVADYGGVQYESVNIEGFGDDPLEMEAAAALQRRQNRYSVIQRSQKNETCLYCCNSSRTWGARV